MSTEITLTGSVSDYNRRLSANSKASQTVREAFFVSFIELV
ncbi:hypothetical protein HDF12_002842 [Edaphobacter lichenicola]|uniref:Uncharacterized protein n=2 Tax=Tunturiibacter TaxID=3154218 RepID=A0A7Y9NN69_9BACT|nr:hypothetical protein [Edaphobacter lichenicola]NYF52443.1 hypothetical protein [Edaphobacter lichenicola]